MNKITILTSVILTVISMRGCGKKNDKNAKYMGLPQNLWVLKACSYPIRGTF